MATDRRDREAGARSGVHGCVWCARRANQLVSASCPRPADEVTRMILQLCRCPVSCRCVSWRARRQPHLCIASQSSWRATSRAGTRRRATPREELIGGHCASSQLRAGSTGTGTGRIAVRDGFARDHSRALDCAMLVRHFRGTCGAGAWRPASVCATLSSRHRLCRCEL